MLVPEVKAFGQLHIDIRELPQLPPPRPVQKNLFNDTENTVVIDPKDDLPF
jgi:hypothetical protein